MEAVAEHPDGLRVPFIPYPTPIFNASGAFIGAVNMLIDISERKRAEESKRFLASIIDTSDDAIISKDINGVIRRPRRGAPVGGASAGQPNAAARRAASGRFGFYEMPSLILRQLFFWSPCWPPWPGALCCC
jgi:hypothetical protein